MNRWLTILTLAAILIAPSALAQERVRTVEQYACKDVMRERGADRDVAIAFLHGFLLGKSGQTSFDLEKLYKESDAFIERCLDSPAEPAVQAMIKAKGSP
jgi:hypothetical protein